MFQKLIALIVAFAIAFSGIVKPVYAAQNYLGTMSTDYPIIINNQGNNNPIYFNNSFSSSDDRRTTQESPNSVVDDVVDGIVTATGVYIGGAVACYAVTGIATLVFPPAAALSAVCPAM